METKTLKIEKLDHFGRGIARNNNKVIFVDNALIGDEVEVEIVNSKNNFSNGRVVKYLKRGESYTKSNCLYEKECGGCKLINLKYEWEKKFKEEKVQELFNKKFKDIKVEKIVTSNDSFNYRNKITLHSNHHHIGLYREKSNEIVDIDKCLIVNDKINDVIKRVKTFFNNQNSFDQIVIKSSNLEEVLISIKGKLDEEKFIDYFSDCDTIIINDEIKKGTGYIKDKILDKYFYVSSKSFFQVNNLTTPKLYQLVVDEVKNKNYSKALDLYSGTGTIGILISDYVGQVIGIEIEKSAVNDALRNVKLNDIKNAKFICGDVKDFKEQYKNSDVVIIDPPRSGLSKEMITNLLEIASQKIIYISCNPNTLVRDLELLTSNYVIDKVIPVDMFPHTYHVETVSILTKKD